MSLETLVEQFERNPPATRLGIKQMLQSDPSEFLRSALGILDTDGGKQGHQYLVSVMLSNGLVLPLISDPNRLGTAQAITLAKLACKVNPLFDLDLAKLLARGSGRQASVSTAIGCRALDILAAISDPDRVMAQITPLLNHADSHLQSKAALFIGKGRRPMSWLWQQIRQEDARIRANVVEAIWSAENHLPAERRAFYNIVLEDLHNRVAANALVGLYLLGDVSSVFRILDMSNHPDALFRTSAVWAMHETGDFRFQKRCERMLSDDSATARRWAERALDKIRGRQKAANAQGPLQIAVMPATMHEGGWEQQFAALTASADPVNQLTGAQVLFWEDEDQPSEYDITPVARLDAITIAMALPASLLDQPADSETVQSAMARCHKLRRKAETWPVIRYSTELPSSSGEAPNTNFLGQSMDISILGQPSRRRGDVARGQAEACSQLHHAIRQSRGSHHIVLVSGEQEAGLQEDLEPLSREAIASSTKVHVVAIGRPLSSSLTSLARATGGSAQRASDLNTAASSIYALCSIPTAGYVSRGTGAAPVRMEIFCGDGHGHMNLQPE